MAMELSASRAISNLPVFSTVLAGNPQLRPRHALPLRIAIFSRSTRSLHFRCRPFFVSLPRAAASDDSNGYRPFITEERDGAIILEDSPAEKLPSDEMASSEEPVEGAQEQTFDLWNGLQFESVDVYNLILYGAGAFLGLWLVSAIVGAIDSIPVVPKLLEVVGLGYTVWFTARYLLLKESRDELAAKVDELKDQVVGSD
ncbi:protein CURVATURE THYLAKOID 1D, chloroplastic-like [Cucurbita maxima]|uniref:Protein CURVATURE THYLAKOID 1D, chloroplastic-like n=1 Tax=Cucurbita maxima TaxID=3661 RepID=A0A6J1J8X3_CUCMA|nr:protein CURVATURE THYLAKOID 1D, chloroplastic-like [Cucurbita maxima]